MRLGPTQQACPPPKTFTTHRCLRLNALDTLRMPPNSLAAKYCFCLALAFAFVHSPRQALGQASAAQRSLALVSADAEGSSDSRLNAKEFFVVESVLTKLGLKFLRQPETAAARRTTDPPSLLLSASLRNFDCAAFNGRLRCTTTVVWELNDLLLRETVYRVTTKPPPVEYAVPQHEVSLRESINRVRLELLKRAATRLMKRTQISRVLFSAPPAATAYTKASYKACNTKPRALPQEASAALDATVVIESGPHIGSGFFLSADGLVLTAAHVVSGREPISIRQANSEKTFPAKVIRRNRIADVALLAVEGVNHSCLHVRKERPDIGQDLYALGAPAGAEFTLTRGIASALRRLPPNPNTFIQTDTPMSPGNSGGPLVAKDGLVVGVVSRKIVREGVENLGFAVSIEDGLRALGLASDTASSLSLFSAEPATELLFEDTEADKDAPPVGESSGSKLPSAASTGTPSAAGASNPSPSRSDGSGSNVTETSSTSPAPSSAPAAQVHQRGLSKLQALRWGGVAVSLAGGAIMLGSFASYDRVEDTRGERKTLATVNTVGGITALLGAAMFGVSLFIPSSPSSINVSLVPHLGGGGINVTY
jgi:serine protease Do